MKNTITKRAAQNHELFEALYNAYKAGNRFNEKLLRVEEIRTGTCRSFHYSLEEETQELKGLLKKAAGKILYLNHLEGGKLLSRQYNRNSLNDMADMVSDFLDKINAEIAELDVVTTVAV